MSEADNPTTPRKRSSHRPAGFGPIASRDQQASAREPEPPPEGIDGLPPSTDLDSSLGSPEGGLGAESAVPDTPVMVNPVGVEPSPTPPHASTLPTSEGVVAGGTAAAAAESVSAESIAAADWVSRLTSEFEAVTAVEEWAAQVQHLQEQNLRLQEQNRDLLEQKAILEITLEETQAALQLQMTRSQNQETLLVQQAQALAESQTQTSSLYRDLELAQQTAQRQQIMLETLTEQLEGTQERIAQLEQEVTNAQAQLNEKVHALMQAEMTCRDLKTRLNRQQRYALQFKTALERCLDMPALRRSMFTATSASTGANPVADARGEADLSAPVLGNQVAETLADSPVVISRDRDAVSPPSPIRLDLASNPTDLDLAEVSSHLHSLLDEAAASSTLTVSDANSLTGELMVGDIPEARLDDRDTLNSEEDNPDIALLGAGEADRASLKQAEGFAEGSQAAPLTEASADWPESTLAEAGLTGSEGKEVEASLAEPAPAAPLNQAAEVAPLPADRMQAELWQRFNQWAAIAEGDDAAASTSVAPEAPSPAPPVAEPAPVAETVVPPLPTSSQRGIQPLRPSPHVPRFVSQWSEAVGRTSPAASQAPAAASQVSPVADEGSVTPVTSFTVGRRRSNAQLGPDPAQPQDEMRGTASEPKRGTTPVKKRIELPDPQGEGAAAANPAAPVAGASEADFQAMANWPSPLVYPLRSAKKRQSLAAIELPNFARPHS